MKNSFFRTVICVALVTILTSLCLNGALAETVKVAVVQPMSHTSLDQIRDTIVSSLEASGIDFEIVLKNA